MKMVLVDCAIQNEPTDNLAEYEITNNPCTNGTLTEVDTIKTEFSQTLPSEPSSEQNSSPTPNENNTIAIPALPSLPDLSEIIPTELPRDISETYFSQSDFVEKINPDRSRVSLKSKLPILTSKRSDLESKLTHCFNTSVPPATQNKALITLSESRSLSDAKAFFESRTSFLKLFTHRVTLRKWFSEPCFVYEDEPTETFPHQKHESNRTKGFIEDTPMLITSEMEAPKNPAPRLLSGIPRSKNLAKSVQKPVRKPANTSHCPRLSRCIGPPMYELRRSRKIDQGTQVELQLTKEVESQTDFKKDVFAKRKKQNSSGDEEDPSNKLGIKKTVVTPFSFMDRCQAYLERKRERMKDKKYELKRWARPALILQKEPYKIVLPEVKLTVPKGVSLETDRRREKWAQYMREFNERQKKLNTEKETVIQNELQKFRSTLVPKIHKVPYKKLGIKPRKAITSSFRKLRETKKHAKPKNTIRGKKQSVENNQSKANKKHTKTAPLNSKQSKQKPAKTDNNVLTQNIEIEFRSSRKHPTRVCDKISNDGKTYNQKIAITINEKGNPNVKNSRVSFSNRRNQQEKISSPIRKESTMLKQNFIPGNAITARDDSDGLYEKYSSNSPSHHNSTKSYTSVPAVRTLRRVF